MGHRDDSPVDTESFSWLPISRKFPDSMGFLKSLIGQGQASTDAEKRMKGSNAEAVFALFVAEANRFQLGGVKLGFWFAQQGSVLVFVALIFFYAWRMNSIERHYNLEED